MQGYIYIRDNQLCRLNKVYKLGRTQCIASRHQQYKTYEIESGKFIFVVQVQNIIYVETLLKQIFKQQQVKINAGTEFFKEQIIYEIEYQLTCNNIQYQKLSQFQINILYLEFTFKKTLNKTVYRKIFNKSQLKLLPRKDQQDIIRQTIEYFKDNDKGILQLICSYGKTLVSLWIAQKLQVKSLIVAVPNLLLVKQWENVIDVMQLDIEYIVTTYQSSHKLKNYSCDLLILDEIHHITGNIEKLSQQNKSFMQILNIKAKKQLGLTATIKIFDNEQIVSNNSYQFFGQIIAERNLYWAIQNKIVCDYIIQSIIFEKSILNKDEFYLAAYCAIKALQQSSNHLLIYCNCIQNMKIIKKYIKQLTSEEIYCSEYHSEQSQQQQQTILDDFNNNNKSEGYDNPLIDTVIFTEKMTSNIRIVQSALRAGRINKNRLDKITKIIIPTFLDDNEKVWEIIYQMGQEDYSIQQKLQIILQTNDQQYQTSKDYNKIITEEIQLHSMSRIQLGITYQQAKNILCSYKLQSISEYKNICNKDIRLNENPQQLYKDQFISWIDYLNIDTQNFYQKRQWIQQCKNLQIDNMEDYLNKIQNDQRMTKMPIEFYKYDNFNQILKLLKDEY